MRTIKRTSISLIVEETDLDYIGSIDLPERIMREHGILENEKVSISNVNNELVVAKFFEKPKCKPWDLVKGRRYACCHYPIGKHSPYCLSWGISISMPKFKELTYYDIVQ